MPRDETATELAVAVTALEQARAHFELGAYGEAREVALSALGERPDDPDLLRIAGRSGVELGALDAVPQLRRVAEARPHEAQSWRDLGDALAAEGRTEEAGEAFKKVLELDPEDEVALTALGHAAYAAGRGQDAVSMLEQVSERSGGTTTATISLVEIHKAVGRPEEALSAAQRIAEADPADPLAALDVAELSLVLGRHDDALEAFGRLRELVDEGPEHDVAALHGMIKVELARGQLGRALELAREAAESDRVGRTTGVLAYLEAEAGVLPGMDELPRNASTTMVLAFEAPPSRDEVESALDASLSELRREYAERGHRFLMEDFLG